MKKRKKYGLSSNPSDQEFFQNLKEMCNKMEPQSTLPLDQIKEKSQKMEIELEQARVNNNDEGNQNMSFNDGKQFSSLINYSLMEKKRGNKSIKKTYTENMEVEKEIPNDENYKYLNFDKISLSGGENEEGVEIFIDSKNNKTYKFVDDMTFECDEI